MFDVDLVVKLVTVSGVLITIYLQLDKRSKEPQLQINDLKLDMERQKLEMSQNFITRVENERQIEKIINDCSEIKTHIGEVHKRVDDLILNESRK